VVAALGTSSELFEQMLVCCFRLFSNNQEFARFALQPSIRKPEELLESRSRTTQKAPFGTESL